MSAASGAIAAGRRRAQWRDARSRLSALELDAEVAAVRQGLEAARTARRRHDVANVFTAVDGAATLLTQDTLSASDRSALTKVLASGLGRLRVLLLASPSADRVTLSEVTSALADGPGWYDGVRVDIAPGLEVVGWLEEITEAVRRLLANANGRAPSSPVTIRADRHGERIELWVDDLGPRLSARERDAVLDPECPRSMGPEAVSLQVAIRLARGQGAEVSIEPGLGRGASFGISWPVPVG